MNDLEKEVTVKWEGLEVTVRYQPNGMPDLILLDAYCESEPIEFLEKVQGNENALDEIATEVGEYWASEQGEPYYDPADYSDEIYERLHNK